MPDKIRMRYWAATLDQIEQPIIVMIMSASFDPGLIVAFLWKKKQHLSFLESKKKQPREREWTLTLKKSPGLSSVMMYFRVSADKNLYNRRIYLKKVGGFQT